MKNCEKNNTVKAFNFVLIEVFLLMFTFGCGEKQTKLNVNKELGQISLSSELKKLIDIQKLPSYENDAKSFQISSYDTTGGNDDGFNGKYSFIRRNSDSTLVMFEAEGPGVIHRIWTPTPNEDTLDFYIDSEDHVSFSIQYADLFSENIFPFVGPLCGNQIGGYYCYLPLPFNKSCKIISRGKKLQFHQIQYKLYHGREVESFSMNLNEEEKLALGKVKNCWNQTQRNIYQFYDKDGLLTEANELELTSGSTKTIFSGNEGGRIVGITLSPSSAFSGLEKQIDLRITWDDEDEPAVYLPIHDFFGFAYGDPSMQSLLLGSHNNVNYCFLPMPYDRQAKIELICRANKGSSPTLTIDYQVYFQELPRDKESEGKFYAQWNRDIHPPTGTPHYLLKRDGYGHYVGTILQAQGLRAGMTYFFEGDDATIIDDELVIHGTGSEDYFNGGWYAFIDRWDSRMSLPLHGALDYSLPFCRTGGYRFYLTDKIPFSKNITEQIEHGPVGNAFPVDYTSIALYYCDSPLKNPIQKPINDLTKVFLPDTLIIYPQLMSYDVWDKIEFESFWKYNTGGMSFVYTVNNESRLRISVDDLPQGSYKLYADFAAFDEGCEFSFWQRQTKISPWISSVRETTERMDQKYICDVDLDNFKNTLTIRFKTKAGQNKLFLNRLIFVKRK